jgi:hypothetical protein
MDRRLRQPDRADPLRSLSQAIARGALQVLQPSLQQRAQQSCKSSHEHEGGTGGRLSGPLDLTHRCEHCDGLMPEASPTGRRRRRSAKYCSIKCLWASAVAIDTLRRLQSRLGRICKWCQGDIPVSRKFRSIYCCARCAKAASRKAAPLRKRTRDSKRLRIEKTCPSCENAFRPFDRMQVCCCHKCASRLAASKKRDQGLKLCRDSIYLYPKWLTPARFDALPCVAVARGADSSN